MTPWLAGSLLLQQGPWSLGVRWLLAGSWAASREHFEKQEARTARPVKSHTQDHHRCILMVTCVTGLAMSQ